MNCVDAAPLIAAQADGETDWRQSRALERHVSGCTDCAAKRQNLLALRTQLRNEVPYFGAPPALRARLQERFAETPATARRRLPRMREAWRWFAGGALAGTLATLLASMAGTALVASHATDEFAREAVAMHVRATLGDHLVQIASTDQHTVKPWLSARLDYSPPVHDWAADGFALAGARIETLGQRPVATLVYGYRLHTIDVFVRPVATPPATATLSTLRGFNVVRGSGDGMEWTAVSDVSADVLTAFVTRLAHGG